jgi:UDP-N-acetylglucosamine acyltransferase
MARVHPTAVVDRHAELAEDVEIGAYCVVGAGVRIGPETKLLSHVVVSGRTTLGRANVVHPFAVIGGAPQIKKAGGGRSATADGRGAVEIGDENVIREHVTINASSSSDAPPTRLGRKNLLMAGSHVAHDVELGACCVVANAVQIAGHAVIEDFVNFGGLSGVAQRVRVGEGAFVAAGSMCERDVPPFVIVQGDRARVRALNVVGLERRGVPAASIAKLRRAFARLFVRRTEPFEQVVGELDRSDPWVAALARAVGAPGRS